jgi:hypothetical protein
MSDGPDASDGDEATRDGASDDEPDPFRFDDEGVEESWTTDPDGADGTGAASGPASGSASGSDVADDAPPAVGTGPEADAGADADGPGADAEGDRAPLDDLAASVRERRERRDGHEAADRSEDSPFEEMSADELDSEVVWETLEPSNGEAAEAEADEIADPDATPDVATDEIGPDPEDDVESIPREDEGSDVARPDHVVPTRSFCERCRYFSEPPEVDCSHEGTEIVELVDIDHFRVRNCPMVDEDVDVDVDVTD